jgi:hypothetical protein
MMRRISPMSIRLEPARFAPREGGVDFDGAWERWSCFLDGPPQARDAGLDAHHDDGPKAGMESVHFRHVIRPRGTRTRVTHVAPAATPHAHSERGEAKEPRRRHRGLRPSGGKAEAVERQPEASTLGRPRDAELTCCASSCS